jgi:hypothetical protein
VRDDLHLTISLTALAERVSTPTDATPGHIVIETTGSDAPAIANSDAVNLIQVAKTNEPTVRLTVVSPAAVPASSPTG